MVEIFFLISIMKSKIPECFSYFCYFYAQFSMNMDITSRFKKVSSEIPENVTIVAVSKTKPESDIMDLYNFGHKVFGENKVQDLVSKYESLPKDINWHFIGHLQSNKVKYIAPFVSLIHGIDSDKLLKVVNKEGIKNERIIDCLLQFHIAREDSKFGFTLEEAQSVLRSDYFVQFKNVRIRGVMGMATYTSDIEIVRSEFKLLYNIFHQLKSEYFNNYTYFSEISMGMSDDFHIAIEEGSTMVRIGSLIFGERVYSK